METYSCKNLSKKIHKRIFKQLIVILLKKAFCKCLNLKKISLKKYLKSKNGKKNLLF